MKKILCYLFGHKWETDKRLRICERCERTQKKFHSLNYWDEDIWWEDIPLKKYHWLKKNHYG
jgi:hypothetical protein